MTFYEQIQVLQAEIERLKAQGKSSVATYEAILDNKNAQIERLQKLISELADALGTTCELLKGYGHYVGYGSELEKRARAEVKP